MDSIIENELFLEYLKIKNIENINSKVVRDFELFLEYLENKKLNN